MPCCSNVLCLSSLPASFYTCLLRMNEQVHYALAFRILKFCASSQSSVGNAATIEKLRELLPSSALQAACKQPVNACHTSKPLLVQSLWHNSQRLCTFSRPLPQGQAVLWNCRVSVATGVSNMTLSHLPSRRAIFCAQFGGSLSLLTCLC